MTITQNAPCDERFSILRSLCQQQPESFATSVVDLSGGSNVHAVNDITAERDDYFEFDREHELLQLQKELRSKMYRPLRSRETVGKRLCQVRGSKR